MAARKSSRPPRPGRGALPRLDPVDPDDDLEPTGVSAPPPTTSRAKGAGRITFGSGQAPPPSEGFSAEPETLRSLGDADPDAEELPSLDGHEEGTNTDRTALMLDLSARGSGRPTLTVLTGLSAGQVYPVRDSLICGRARDVDIVLRDPGVSRHHAKFTRGDGANSILEDLGSTNGVRVNGVRVHRCELRAGDRVQLGPEVVLQFALLDDAEENLTKQLYAAATRDALTQSLNRRAFDERLAAEFSYARRHASKLSVVVFDIDHFKKINDSFGHPAGDLVLREVAQSVRRTIRSEDVFARYGGEEFVILVRGESPEQTTMLAERVREAVRQLEIKAEGKAIVVTVSAGVAELAECAKTAMPSALVKLADERLYRAKQAGRDRVCSS